METNSVSPKLNPKVKGNFRLEHDYANTMLFAKSGSIRSVKKHNNKENCLLKIFIMKRTSTNIFNF